jgi:hypothetical protein
MGIRVFPDAGRRGEAYVDRGDMRARLCVTAAAAISACVLAVVAAAATSYPDRAGDVARGAGPDVVSVAVSNSASQIGFRLRFAQSPPLRVSARDGWIDMLVVGIDVPPFGPGPTVPGGEWRGADFALGTHGPSKTGLLARLAKSGSRLVTRFRIVTRGSTLTFTIPRSALGDPARFAFTLAAARELPEGETGGGVDVAPGRGTFRYVLVG